MQDHSKDRNNIINGRIDIYFVTLNVISIFMITEIRKKNSAQFDNITELASIDMDDLIHLLGPLTEDAVMKTLQARFIEKKYFVSCKA